MPSANRRTRRSARIPASAPRFPHRLSAPLAFLLVASLASCDRAQDPADGAIASAESSRVEERSASEARETSARGTPIVLVDSALAPAIAGEDGWMYSQSSQADLDGDGQDERLVMTARAEVLRGRPVWDDGQPWQVYVEEEDGARTYLYARFVQLGSVTMRIALPVGEGPPSVVLLEHLPDRIALFEAWYEGPGNVTVVEHFARRVDPRGEGSTPIPP